jgi:hypothetical protein
MSFKVQNWPSYEAGLRRRGSLALWLEDGALEHGALEHWQTCGEGGQARDTEAAIQMSLVLRTAFKLPLRQTEGLMASVITLTDPTISAPDHTPASRRAVTLPVIQPASVPSGPLHVLIDSSGLQGLRGGPMAGSQTWCEIRRKWHKLHLAVDAGSGMSVAQTLTDQDADDPSQVAPLLDQIDGPLVRMTADGAYDGDPTYQTTATHGDTIEVVIHHRKVEHRQGPPRRDVAPVKKTIYSLIDLREILPGCNRRDLAPVRARRLLRRGPLAAAADQAAGGRRPHREGPQLLRCR